jgi:histidyl-tRNA synthetase
LGSTKPPGGTRDFLPGDIRRREHVIGVVRDVYERYGFEPLETPAFENIETLLGKYGEEGNKLIFKILRRGEHESSGEADLALRYDLTVPLARVVAQYQSELPRFFKRYQIQEFFQCDVDVIGTTSALAEVELISAVAEVMKTLGFKDFVVRLNDRRVLTALIETAGIPQELSAEALVAIDKLDKIGPDGVVAELIRRGVEPKAAARSLELFATSSVGGTTKVSPGGASTPAAVGPVANGAVLEHLAAALARHEAGTSALVELRSVLDLARKTPGGDRVAIDPSLARGLSYYTGAIMEIAVPDLAGSLGGGGRYDGLIGMFLGRDVPACGFSLGLERIIFVMGERNMFPENVCRPSADVMVTLWNDTSRQDAIALASEMRSDGLRVDVYSDAHKIGNQLKYAASRAVPVVTIVGDDELARGEVKIKDLRTRAEFSVSRAGVTAKVREILSANRKGLH